MSLQCHYYVAIFSGIFSISESVAIIMTFVSSILHIGEEERH